MGLRIKQQFKPRIKARFKTWKRLWSMNFGHIEPGNTLISQT
jgi:hypothetical protein